MSEQHRFIGHRAGARCQYPVTPAFPCGRTGDDPIHRPHADEWRNRGWFADIDPDADPRYPWQPVLQIDGMCVSVALWSPTEEDCMHFIRTEILGRGLLDHNRV